MYVDTSNIWPIYYEIGQNVTMITALAAKLKKCENKITHLYLVTEYSVWSSSLSSESLSVSLITTETVRPNDTILLDCLWFYTFNFLYPSTKRLTKIFSAAILENGFYLGVRFFSWEV